jgi:hypothetical protein
LKVTLVDPNLITTPEYLLSVIDNAPKPGPNDTMVFYYAGHGFIDTAQRLPYLYLPEWNNLPRGNLARSAVIKHLQDKGARLTVLLTDCSSSFAAAASRLPGKSLHRKDPPATTSPLFTALFLKPSSLVDVTGASPGEYGLYWPTGGIFTVPLVTVLENQKDSADVTWPTFVVTLRTEVAKHFQQQFPEGWKDEIGHVQWTQTVYAYQLPQVNGLMTNVEPVSPARGSAPAALPRRAGSTSAIFSSRSMAASCGPKAISIKPLTVAARRP